MEDLAAIAGVSAITVSRALRNSPLVTEKTRAKVREIAEQQGYRLNISARNLRLRRSYSVAVVVEMTPAKNRPMSDPYPLDLLGGITQELTTAGYSVLLTSKQLIDTAPVQSADGMILLGQGPHGEAVQALQRTGLPLVVCGARPMLSIHASWSAAIIALAAPAWLNISWRAGASNWYSWAISIMPKSWSVMSALPMRSARSANRCV